MKRRRLLGREEKEATYADHDEEKVTTDKDAYAETNYSKDEEVPICSTSFEQLLTDSEEVVRTREC